MSRREYEELGHHASSEHVIESANPINFGDDLVRLFVSESTQGMYDSIHAAVD